MCTFYASLPSRIESLDFPLFFYDPSMIIAGAGYDPLAVASARIVRWRLQNPFRALFERRKPRQGTAIASKGNEENLLLAWQPTQNEPPALSASALLSLLLLFTLRNRRDLAGR